MSGATKADRSKLGGLVRRQVVRDLALSGLSQDALAEKYGVSQQAISQFKARNAEEIAAVAAKADDEFAGILIAQKAARLAAYQELYGVAVSPTPKISASGKTVTYVDPESGESGVVMEVDVRAAATVLKQAAEEMGQLPTRLQVSGELATTTTYRIENVSNDDLT
jgi:transcriptional regulator with XRE-family HTH domain